MQRNIFESLDYALLVTPLIRSRANVRSWRNGVLYIYFREKCIVYTDNHKFSSTSIMFKESLNVLVAKYLIYDNLTVVASWALLVTWDKKHFILVVTIISKIKDIKITISSFKISSCLLQLLQSCSNADLSAVLKRFDILHVKTISPLTFKRCTYS